MKPSPIPVTQSGTLLYRRVALGKPSLSTTTLYITGNPVPQHAPRNAGYQPAIQQINNLRYGVGIAIFITLLIAASFSGCASGRAQRPGRAAASLSASAALPTTAEVVQPENPAQASSQTVERVKETELPLPAATRITEIKVTPPVGKEPAVTNTRTIVLSEPTVEKSRIVERAGASIGAAQKDTAREMGVKLASMRPAVWIGLLLVAAGIGIATYPPLRVAVGSMTTAIACIVGGLALMVLPVLIVGNEVLIIGLVVGGVLLWWFAHRHGALKAAVTSSAPREKAPAATPEVAR